MSTKRCGENCLLSVVVCTELCCHKITHCRCFPENKFLMHDDFAHPAVDYHHVQHESESMCQCDTKPVTGNHKLISAITILYRFSNPPNKYGTTIMCWLIHKKMKCLSAYVSISVLSIIRLCNCRSCFQSLDSLEWLLVYMYVHVCV